MQDGSSVAADVIVFCTGYQKTYDYLPGTLKANLQLQRDGLYLVSVTLRRYRIHVGGTKGSFLAPFQHSHLLSIPTKAESTLFTHVGTFPPELPARRRTGRHSCTLADIGAHATPAPACTLAQYRNMVSPLVHNLAFIGSEVATNNNILTHGLQVWIKCGSATSNSTHKLQI